MIGKQIAHYRVEVKLGEGGMGEVYRARDTKLNRDVALKVLATAVAEDPEREAKAVAALNHPDIVTIHSVEELDGVHCIIMELVEGRTLSQMLPKQGSPWANSCRLPFRREPGTYTTAAGRRTRSGWSTRRTRTTVTYTSSLRDARC